MNENELVNNDNGNDDNNNEIEERIRVLQEYLSFLEDQIKGAILNINELLQYPNRHNFWVEHVSQYIWRTTSFVLTTVEELIEVRRQYHDLVPTVHIGGPHRN